MLNPTNGVLSYSLARIGIMKKVLRTLSLVFMH